MKKKLFPTLLFACFSLICVAAVIDVGGKWKAVIHNADSGEDYPVTYVFKTDGAKFTGTLQTGIGDMPISDGRFKGDSIFFTVNFNGTDMLTSGKCYTDSITLNVPVQGFVSHTVLTRDH